MFLFFYFYRKSSCSIFLVKALTSKKAFTILYTHVCVCVCVRKKEKENTHFSGTLNCESEINETRMNIKWIIF